MKSTWFELALNNQVKAAKRQGVDFSFRRGRENVSQLGEGFPTQTVDGSILAYGRQRVNPTRIRNRANPSPPLALRPANVKLP